MNGRTHQAVAIPAGVGISVLQTQGYPVFTRIFEAAGACCAASLGARLPDLWDPPNSPVHRSWAHSLSLAVAGTAGACASLPDLQRHLRGARRLPRSYGAEGHRSPCSALAYCL